MQLAPHPRRPRGAPGAARACARAPRPGGRLALAILAELAAVSAAGPVRPLPDVREIDGWVYSSLPIEVRLGDGALEVRRLRQLVAPDGTLQRAARLDPPRPLDAAELEAEARAAGSAARRERIAIPATEDHVGSIVVVMERRDG